MILRAFWRTKAARSPILNSTSYWIGSTPYNVKHNLRVNALYRIPNVKGDNWAAKTTAGWWLGGIVSAQSGFPFSPTLGYFSSLSDAANSGNAERASYVTSSNLAQALALNPNAVAFNPATVITGNPNQWFNPNMFTTPPDGSHGDVEGMFSSGPISTWTCPSTRTRRFVSWVKAPTSNSGWRFSIF